MTSPVERISGPSMRVDAGEPGKREDGFLDGDVRSSFAAHAAEGRRVRLSPAMTRAAILAIGSPTVLATNGTVREARGLTSST
jgi:hypothetical protein